MLQPKRVKHRKVHRGRRRGKAQVGNTVAFGEFGMQALGSAWITARQIEAARRAITHHVRRGGKVWIRIFPDKPVTAKPAETRMGSGKGNVDYWVAVVKPGRIIFEIAGVREDLAKEAIRLASSKLPIPTRFVYGTEEIAARGRAIADRRRRRFGGLEAEVIGAAAGEAEEAEAEDEAEGSAEGGER